MASWIFDPNQYEAQDFSIVPVGDHRVRIEDVITKQSKAGNDMFEITLAVSGHNSRLWYYLVLDHSDVKKTNQRIGGFFDSFGITDNNMDHYRGWIGKVGAVRVKHEEYNGSQSAKVAFCISRSKQDKLPPAQFSGAAPVAPSSSFSAMPDIPASELPFN